MRPLNTLLLICIASSCYAQNLITNSDFEQGNTGFSSQYSSSAGCNPSDNTLPEGNYCVKSSTAQYTGYLGWAPDCPDHTTNQTDVGNKMIVNGDTKDNVKVWCQSVTVEPNTNYKFSAWLASIFSGPNNEAPSLMAFSVNGQNLGTPFQASTTRCEWNQFFELWNSGENTSAEICIVNKNLIGNGNDFMLDDLSFEKIDLVLPNVLTPNSDGKNDVFKPISLFGIDALKMSVYNRWGIKVYESEDVTAAWNGKMNNDGGECPVGTYYYIVEYEIRPAGKDPIIGTLNGFVTKIN